METELVTQEQAFNAIQKPFMHLPISIKAPRINLKVVKEPYSFYWSSDLKTVIICTNEYVTDSRRSTWWQIFVRCKAHNDGTKVQADGYRWDYPPQYYNILPTLGQRHSIAQQHIRKLALLSQRTIF